jgi:hypothetical protein
MDNRPIHVVETEVDVALHPAGKPEQKEEWWAPELKKFEISEVTANGGILSGDGITSS